MIKNNTWSKVLSRNDVGETGANQSGIYIPLGEKNFFSPMKFSSNNDSRDIEVVDSYDRKHKWKLKWYIKPDGRKEFHITYSVPLMNELHVFSGDTISLEKIAQNYFRVNFCGPTYARGAEKRIALVGGQKELKIYSSQGYIRDVKTKRAIENHAMCVVRNYYEQHGYQVNDMSATNPYDLLCVSPDVQLHVEVKGTSGNGEEVFLTKNEVRHSREKYPATALAIVKSINVTELDGEVRAEGGVVEVYAPWQPLEDHLEALTFKYKVPQA